MRVSAVEATIATLEAAVRDLGARDPLRRRGAPVGRGCRARRAALRRTQIARCEAGVRVQRLAGPGRTHRCPLAGAPHRHLRGPAVTTLETAARLRELPALDAAYRAGALSPVQANEIASAAAADPAAERELVDVAATEGVPGLRERCRRVKVAATPDGAARHEAIRRTRSLRHWTDPDGVFRLDGRLLPEDGAELLAGLEPLRARIFVEARAAGRREPYEAYLADALVAMARDARTGSDATRPVPRASIHVRVDHTAFRRGHVEAGETCEILGIGPIPVASARALVADAVISAIVCDGVDVKSVAHLGRTIPARVRTALVARDPVCVVPGCHTRTGLEIDHIVPFAEGGATCLANLCRLCRWHHYLKTHQGCRLTGGPGDWRWESHESHGHGPPRDIGDEVGPAP
ncbi:MAG: DUF222 domain-containing protein [Actinobacteria bacterium]|nr:MAG: DUF222 domain-containing protein [Actinomycetota bacterium]